MRVGLVGTGMLGEAIGMRLLKQGFEVVAYNRTLQKTAGLGGAGAKIVRTPRQVAEESGLIITCVRDAPAVTDVSFGPGGLAEAGAGLTVFDMSTINPMATRRISGRFSEAGAQMLDTPVMGGPDAALEGRLVVMASGERAAFDAHRGVLDAVAERVFYLGPVGTAHSIKLAMNLQIAMLATALSEGIILARGASVDPRVFLDVLNATYFGTGMSRKKAYRMIGGSFEPTFLLRNLRKDLHEINESAASFGLRLPMGSLAEELYRNATEEGLGDLDYTGIMSYLEGHATRRSEGRQA